MAIFFLPSNQNRGRGGAALTGGGPWAAALPGTAAVGKWGNGERQSMATDSRPRLGVGSTLATTCNRGATGGGGGELGK
jgi:hypothetical protein